MSLGGLFQPMDEGFHFDVDDFLCSSEADSDDYDGHVRDSEMTFGAFPEAELEGAVMTVVSGCCADTTHFYSVVV